MWVFLIFSIALAFGLAYIITGFEAVSVMSQWDKYRCIPHIMTFAFMFKPKDDPRSDLAFTTDNFNFCTAEIAKSVLEVALKPILDVVLKMIETSIASIGYVMNLRTLSSNLFHGLERIFDIFGRRFNMTIHEFHKTFIKQIAALEKANAIATSSLFAGLSMIKAIQNAFELMIIVCIAILVILVVLVIFLFFLLAPVIPVIFVALGIIGATAYAGATGGMGNAFCFHPDTKIRLMEGEIKTISEICLGDILIDGSSVLSTMKFKTDENTVLFNNDGVIVSGTHIIYEGGIPKLVQDSLTAKIYDGIMPDTIYCLNTSLHKIPVEGVTKQWVYADWEELDSESMEDWSDLVYYLLNNFEKRVGKVSVSVLDSETGFVPEQRVPLRRHGEFHETCMGNLKLGDTILDGQGNWTTVTGLVKTTVDENNSFGYFNNTLMSGANWVLDQTDNAWKHVAETNQWQEAQHPASYMISIFTESGTFNLDGNVFRDFSDIGLDNIHNSYNFTLSRLKHLDE